MANAGQHQILASELLAALLVIEMLISVSSLSVPGLLPEYLLVEGDRTKDIFKLKMRINAKDFTLKASFEYANNSFKEVCELFRIKIDTDTNLMVTLKEKVNSVNGTNRLCVATIKLQVICNTPPSEFDDCWKEAKYNVTIKILKGVSCFLLDITVLITCASKVVN